MYVNPQKRSTSEVQELRKEAGRWLKQRREAVGLSQRQLSAAVGVDYYTFVSQLETGRGRIPPDRMMEWAQALKMDVREFTRTIMKFYDPVTYAILFTDQPEVALAEKEAKAEIDRQTVFAATSPRLLFENPYPPARSPLPKKVD